MSMFRNRETDARGRVTERTRRADEAPRLLAEVPALLSLHLEVEVFRGEYAVSNSKHIRRITVEAAPAVFEMPCVNSFCRDGGHDLTFEVLRSLRRGIPRFEGEDGCRGRTGSAECSCSLRYVVVATYRV